MPHRHSGTELHRSTNDLTGANIAAGQHLVTDGTGGFDYEAAAGTSSVPFDHGNMGATETVDFDDGDWHRGTLNANCAITVQGFDIDEGQTLLFKVTTASPGGFSITWDADVEFLTDDQPGQTTGDVTWFMLWSDEGNATIYGATVGAGSGITVENEGTPLATDATTLDFVGDGVTASGTGAEKTITIPGVTAAALEALGVVGPLLISDTPSTPLVFDDILQNDDQDDFLYADLG